MELVLAAASLTVGQGGILCRVFMSTLMLGTRCIRVPCPSLRYARAYNLSPSIPKGAASSSLPLLQSGAPRLCRLSPATDSIWHRSFAYGRMTSEAASSTSTKRASTLPLKQAGTGTLDISRSGQTEITSWHYTLGW